MSPMSPPFPLPSSTHPLPIYGWPPPQSNVGHGCSQNQANKFPIPSQQQPANSHPALPGMSPLAALQQQLEQKQLRASTQWHRRLSPLKKKPPSSLLCRPSTSSSASPQRRPPSPEKRQQRPVALYQGELTMNGGGATTSAGRGFQEAWEHLSRQCAVQQQQRRGSEQCQQRLLPLSPQSTPHSLPPSPTKQASMSLPMPTSPPSTSASSPLEMPDSVNPIGRAIVTAPIGGTNAGKEKQQPEKARPSLAPSSSTETMSSSILASPAWYRDGEGRTGYRPDDFSHGARVQSSPIKVIPPHHQQRQHQNGHHIPSILAAQQQKQNAPDQPKPVQPVPLQPRHLPHQPLQHVPKPIRHTSTLPLPSSSQTPFQGLPPIAPSNGGGGGPFPLRRTQNSHELSSSERAKREWLLRNGARLREEQNEQQQMMRTSTQSQQKVVKFAETVQVNEIAPREEMESSLCSSNSSASSSNSSSASQSSSSDEEGLANAGRRREMPSSVIQPEMPNSALKRTTPPPLAIVRPRQAPKESQDGQNGRPNGQGTVQNGENHSFNGRANGKALENGTKHVKQQKAAQPWSDTADLERVIEQFFRHCQSLSSLNPAAEHAQPQPQSSHAPQQPPLQQRSVYDNLAEEDGAGPKSPVRNGGGDWLHTKAKVVAQQNSGPLQWGRDGSPTRRRVEMLVTSGNGHQEPIGKSNGASSSSYASQTLPFGGGPLGSRKSNSAEPFSRIPLPRPSATIRPNGPANTPQNGHQSGSESSSSSSGSSLALGSRQHRIQSNTTTRPSSGNQRPFAVVRSRAKF